MLLLAKASWLDGPAGLMNGYLLRLLEGNMIIAVSYVSVVKGLNVMNK